ncbi:MAG TPA: hypothetical protein VLY21_01145 [Nitrososphaerales archaeon]|nr:hypothetical protein [Nitrososphaerales archaeon]
MMNRAEAYEDLSTVLFLVPFLVAGVYAIVLWVGKGFSALLPTDVYLTVTRDPYVFLIGSFAVFGAVYVDVRSQAVADRPKRLTVLSGTLQKVAAASFILALLCALYANLTNPSNTVLDFIVGRYSLVFPALLVLLSYLIVIPLNSGDFGRRRLLGIVVMLLVPVTIYEVGKRDSLVGIGIGFILLIAGLVIFLWNRPKPTAEGSE